jgi:hypothetical protein
MQPTPVQLAADPGWFPWRYDEAADAFRFRRLTRADHARATFLTDDYLGAGELVAAPRVALAAALPPPAPLHFIFHSAFCLSTVLARAFDLPGQAMAWKEPMLFNDLAGWQLRGAGGPALAAAMETGLALLARPLAPGETVVAKPSNIANALIAGMLQLRPQARALLLHAPLPVYLGSIARKGLDGRLWVRDLISKQRGQRLGDFGMTGDDLLQQTDLQVAALGWLAQQQLFARLAARHPQRVRSIDSETLARQPAAAMDALGRLFGVALDGAAIAAGPAFTRHSKDGAAFDAAARTAARAAEAAHADEIAKVVVWAGKVAEAHGVPMQLPAPLLG